VSDVDCQSTSDTEALLACLRKLDAILILEKEWVTTEFVVNSSLVLRT